MCPTLEQENPHVGPTNDTGFLASLNFPIRKFADRHCWRDRCPSKGRSPLGLCQEHHDQLVAQGTMERSA